MLDQSSASEFSVALVGSGGAGVVTAGNVLLDAVTGPGGYGLLRRSSGPQIRGGESAALLRFSAAPVECSADHYDMMVALDWRNVDRFIDEIPLDQHSLVICDSGPEDAPEAITASGARLVGLPLAETASDVDYGRTSMVALGVLCAVTDLSVEQVDRGIEALLGEKGQRIVAAARECVRRGVQLGARIDQRCPLPGALQPGPRRWLMTGNEACGLGALRGGVRFVAAYPITPASEVLEWLAPRLDGLGGVLLQAEDELASINMIIGASFGGVPAMTATSGPGLALMMEAVGLAVASETPVVVLNVMRGGPSTGIPTKSEQTDLNIAVYGCHGEAPHLVIAPNSIGDAAVATQWAVALAERLQTAAIVLSDQAIGQSRAVIDPPASAPLATDRRNVVAEGHDYRRYALRADGVSAMAIPGARGMAYTAEGLAHNEYGVPSTRAQDHVAQLDKRWRKLSQFDFGNYAADVEGSGATAVLTWGSCTAAAREAVRSAARDGGEVRLVSLRLLAPFPLDQFTAAMSGVERVLIVEQSHSAQFYRYLRSQASLPPEVRVLARPGPLPITAGEILKQFSGDEPWTG